MKSKKQKPNKPRKKIVQSFISTIKLDYSWWLVGAAIITLLIVSYIKKIMFFKQHPLAAFIPVVLICVFIIMKSAGFAIESISHYAKQTGISEYVIGFLVVAVGTSMPELATAYFSSLAGKGGYVLGDVIGANIMNITLVLGVMAIIGKKIKLTKGILDKTVTISILMALLPLILGLDGAFSRIDGAILLGAFLFYILTLIEKQGQLGTVKKDVSIKNIWQDIIVFGGTIAALLLSANLLVQSLDVISTELGIPTIIVGAVFLAIATTVPELTIGIRSVLKGMSSIGLGDIFGSVIVNTSLVLGMAALINPIKIMDKPLLIFSQGLNIIGSFDYLSFIIGCLILLFTIFIMSIFIKTLVLTKKHGKILVSIVAIFFIVQIILAVLKNIL